MYNGDGSLFFEANALDVDLLLTKAQAGIDVSDNYNFDVWLDRFHNLLIENYSSPEIPPQDQITRQDAWVIYVKCSESMQGLKKNMMNSATFVKPMESTPST